MAYYHLSIVIWYYIRLTLSTIRPQSDVIFFSNIVPLIRLDSSRYSESRLSRNRRPTPDLLDIVMLIVIYTSFVYIRIMYIHIHTIRIYIYISFRPDLQERTSWGAKASGGENRPAMVGSPGIARATSRRLESRVRCMHMSQVVRHRPAGPAPMV